MNDSKLFHDEFKNMFLDEIVELPSVRKINHAIDFVNYAVSISRALYLYILVKHEQLEILVDMFAKQMLHLT